MSQPIVLFRIMIASPGDVNKERQAACEAIYRWNSLNSSDKNVVLLPLCWELDAPAGVADDAQEIIDKHLVEKSDMIIGIFRSKLGRKSSVFQSYTTGEIKKHIDKRKQAMLCFGRPSSSAATVQESENRTKLLEFKTNIKKSLGVDALYKEYKSISDFKANIYAWIENFVNAHLLSESVATRQRKVPSFDSVVIPRTSLQQRIEEAKKSIFISGASLISTLTTSFEECNKKKIEIRLLMTLYDKELIKKCAQLSYTTPAELEGHICATLKHFKSVGIPPRTQIKAIDAVMPFALVGIDIKEPWGKIYVQQYLYETDPATDPNYICYHGDKWFSVYFEQIEKMWNNGKPIQMISI